MRELSWLRRTTLLWMVSLYKLWCYFFDRFLPWCPAPSHSIDQYTANALRMFLLLWRLFFCTIRIYFSSLSCAGGKWRNVGRAISDSHNNSYRYTFTAVLFAISPIFYWSIHLCGPSLCCSLPNDLLVRRKSPFVFMFRPFVSLCLCV